MLHPVAYVLLPAVALLLFGSDLRAWWRGRPGRGFEVILERPRPLPPGASSLA